MDLFFIDKNPITQTEELQFGNSRESLGIKAFFEKYENKSEKVTKESKRNPLDINEFKSLMGWNSEAPEGKESVRSLDVDLAKSNVTDALKTVTNKSLERRKGTPILSKNQTKKLKKQIRSQDKGRDWFNLPAPEVTDEIKNDLQILQMRSVLDPKHFYKKNDLKVLPKYFQIGKYVDSPLDYHNEKNVKKTKSRSIVDDLLADAEFQKRIKQKYKETLIKKKPYHQKHNRQSRRQELRKEKHGKKKTKI